MIEQYTHEIVQALVGLLVVFVLGIIASLRVKVQAWLAAHASAAQRDALAKLAQEGMALAEATYKSLGGPEKLNKAIEYVTSRVPWAGVDAATIRAAVEKAVLDYNAQVKGKQANVQGA